MPRKPTKSVGDSLSPDRFGVKMAVKKGPDMPSIAPSTAVTTFKFQRREATINRPRDFEDIEPFPQGHFGHPLTPPKPGKIVPVNLGNSK
jgi:hypothetical protein